MNIFFLDFDPDNAAKFHCDKHVVKMILESAQLLYSAHHMIDNTILPNDAYRKTHVNHPCSIWVRESSYNYQWLCRLGLALCQEYTYRYGKIHKTQRHLEWLSQHVPDIPDNGMTMIRQAMPDEYKVPHPIQAYRKYYIENKLLKRGIVKYTKRDIPPFFYANNLHDRDRL
jgi:hypothetical protein